MVSWHPNPSGHEAQQIAAIEAYVEHEKWEYVTWLVRERAQIVGKDIFYSHTGYFGNEYSTYHVYRFAVMLGHVPTNDALFQ